MIVTIHQPQFLPWLGYFDKIRRADVFVSLDTVQFKKNEFQNRNRIKTAQGWQWLTVPVRHRHPQALRDVEINSTNAWQHKLVHAIRTNYTKSPYYDEHGAALEALLERDWHLLAPLNLATVRFLLERFGIRTPVREAAEIGASDHPTQRLVDICSHLGAEVYLSGAGGQSYLELERFEEAGIRVEFQDFTHPEYPQLYGAFEPYMSAIDLLLNAGRERSAEVLSTPGA